MLYYPKSEAWAIGFGHDVRVSKGNNFFGAKLRTTEILKEIYLPIQSKERCIESLTSNGGNASYFTDRMFCAGDGRGMHLI